VETFVNTAAASSCCGVGLPRSTRVSTCFAAQAGGPAEGDGEADDGEEDAWLGDDGGAELEDDAEDGGGETDALLDGGATFEPEVEDVGAGDTTGLSLVPLDVQPAARARTGTTATTAQLPRDRDVAASISDQSVSRWSRAGC
jgi:hypothetical protein